MNVIDLSAALLHCPCWADGGLCRLMVSGSSSAPAGLPFQWEVIAVALRWYLRYGLSYGDVSGLR